MVIATNNNISKGVDGFGLKYNSLFLELEGSRRLYIPFPRHFKAIFDNAKTEQLQFLCQLSVIPCLYITYVVSIIHYILCNR